MTMTDIPIRRPAEPEIDASLLQEARRHLGLSSSNETINACLQRVVMEERARRRRGLERLRQMADEGYFDFSKIDAADQ